MESIDPFKYLEVEFSGISPDGKLSYENNYGKDEVYGYLSITPDKSYGLKTGDEVVFTVSNFENVNN